VQHSVDRSERTVAGFTIFEPIINDRVWWLELHVGRPGKRDSVLSQVLDVLLGIELDTGFGQFGRHDLW